MAQDDPRTASNRLIGQRPDVRKKRSANAKLQWADPDARQQRSDAYIARFQDPEFKAAVLAKRKATIDAKKNPDR